MKERNILVAEIGQNHCGDMKLARTLIRLAKQNGADLAKFQLFDSQKYYGHPVKAELTKDQAFKLFEYGKQQSIEVFFSVFDVERVKWCEEMGVARYKVASCMNHSRPLIDAVVATQKEFSLSCHRREDAYVPESSKIARLYCVALYPAELKYFHFGKIEFPSEFQGLSDHSVGLDVCKMAIARGAGIIEKHFAIDHKTGVDAEWSMTPTELRELRKFCDTVQKAL